VSIGCTYAACMKLDEHKALAARLVTATLCGDCRDSYSNRCRAFLPQKRIKLPSFTQFDPKEADSARPTTFATQQRRVQAKGEQAGHSFLPYGVPDARPNAGVLKKRAVPKEVVQSQLLELTPIPKEIARICGEYHSDVTKVKVAPLEIKISPIGSTIVGPLVDTRRPDRVGLELNNGYSLWPTEEVTGAALPWLIRLSPDRPREALNPADSAHIQAIAGREIARLKPAEVAGTAGSRLLLTNPNAMEIDQGQGSSAFPIVCLGIRCSRLVLRTFYDE